MTTEIENTTADTGAPDQPRSLAESVKLAHDELAASAKEGGADPIQPAQNAPDAPQPFELPGYTARWNEAARNALKSLGEAKHNRSYLDPVLAQLEETNKYITNRDTEFARFRQQFEPIGQVIAPLQQQWTLQGITPAQGVAQLVEYANFIASAPDQAFPHIAAMYRPNDPGKALQALAKQWGVDTAALSQEQPYIDPTIQSLVDPLRQELDQLRQQSSQQALMARQRQQDAVVAEIRSLQEQKDDNGNPRFPHLEAVFPRMAQLGHSLAQSGLVRSIPELYDFVVNNDPELSKQQREAQAKAAEEKARKEAAARTAQVRQERESNQTIAGKGQQTGSNKANSLDSAARAAYAELERAA